MKNNIFKSLIFFFIFIIIFIVYLSTIGIETDRFNNQIKNKVNKINKSLDVDLKKIKLILDPLNFKIYAKTVGTTVYYSKKPLALESIKTQISLNSLIKNKITSSNIQVTTRSIIFKDLIKFIRAVNNKPELIILEKILKKGHIILDLSLNFDDNGKIKEDYEIKGLIKEAKINFLNQANFENLNFNFNLKKDNYSLNEIKFKIEKVNFISKKIIIKKKQKSFLIDGNVKNDKSNINSKIIKLLNLNFENLIIEDVNFKSDNKFIFEIDNKFNIKNINLDSDINFDQLKYKKPDILKNYLLNVDNLILLNNQKINLTYEDEKLTVEGNGDVQLSNNEIDQINYLINKKDKHLNLNANLFLKNINFKKQEFLKTFFPETSEKINFTNQELKIKYNKNNLSISGLGKIKINKEFEEINYFF